MSTRCERAPRSWTVARRSSRPAPRMPRRPYRRLREPAAGRREAKGPRGAGPLALLVPVSALLRQPLRLSAGRLGLRRSVDGTGRSRTILGELVDRVAGL